MPQYGNYIYDYDSGTQTLTPAEEAFEKLPAESVRRVVERAMASEGEKQAADQFHTDEQVFRKMNPAYVNDDHNMKLMQHNWRQQFRVEIPTLAQLEESYFALRAAGVLHLNAKAIAKEDSSYIEQRALQVVAERREAEEDLAAAETMPMAKLEALARGWK